MLETHPLADRLRIVGLEDQPAWQALGAVDFAAQRGWSVASLRSELLSVLEREVADGLLADVGTLVIECSVIPQFRRDIRDVTRVPILDVAAAAQAVLGPTRSSVG